MTEPVKPLKIVKPATGFLNKFKSTKPPTIAGVETLLTPLPVMRIADANDFVRLHESDDTGWTPELCFVSVPIEGEKRDMLHLIDEDIALKYLHAKKIKRHRLALATRAPGNKFFLCIVPSQNLDNLFNKTALAGCEMAKTKWAQALSRKPEGVEEYKIEFADEDAFDPPNWPTRTLEELIQVTFKGACIDTEDHPGLRRLIGKRQDLT